MRCSMRESHCSRHRNEPQLHPARNSTTHRVLRTIELPCRQSTESTPERPIIGTSAYHYPRKSSGGDRRCFRQHSLTLTLPATLSRTQGPPLPSVAGGRAAVRTGHKGTAWGCEARSTTTRGDGESRGGVRFTSAAAGSGAAALPPAPGGAPRLPGLRERGRSII